MYIKLVSAGGSQMSSFKEWAVSSGKLNKDTASTYWSGLTNTKFKHDNVPVAELIL